MLCRLFLTGTFLMGLISDPIEADANYDEGKIPAYTLPDPLRDLAGNAITDPQKWANERRPEILALFEEHVYGRTPRSLPTMTTSVVKVDERALDGLAVHQVTRIVFGNGPSAPAMHLHTYRPAGAAGPVPVFVGIHLFDPTKPIPMPGDRVVSDRRPLPKEIEPARMPAEKTIHRILERGYAITTIQPQDVADDDPKTYRDDVMKLLRPEVLAGRLPNEWGALGVWAWALSRAVDVFEKDPAINARRVIAIGHSRRGKAALWAAAQDTRFAAVISNQSGCGGAALSKRRFGETVALINRRFPHWFCENFRQYDDHEENLPVDQHELIALMAPRPVYVGSAEQDRWADPKGEFLSALHAAPVYELLGAKALGTTEFPPVNTSVGHAVGYHVRSGEHALADFDWMLYLDWVDRVLTKSGEANP